MREDYLRHATEVGRRLGDKKIRAGFVQALTPEVRYALCRAVTLQNRRDAEAAIKRCSARFRAITDAHDVAMSRNLPGLVAELKIRMALERLECRTCAHHNMRHDDAGRCERIELHASNRRLVQCPCTDGPPRAPLPTFDP